MSSMRSVLGVSVLYLKVVIYGPQDCALSSTMLTELY